MNPLDDHNLKLPTWMIELLDKVKSESIEHYLQSQQAECDELEKEISGVTMLLQVSMEISKRVKFQVERSTR